MQWPWQRSDYRTAQQAEYDQRIERLNQRVDALYTEISHQTTILEQVPKIARIVVKSSGVLDDLLAQAESDKSAHEASDQARELILNQTAEYLMRWVDELSRAVMHQNQSDLWSDTHHVWLKQATAALEKMGFIEIPVLGKLFDPKVAQAVGTVVDTEHPPYVVVEVVERGYLRADQLWRRAAVITVAPLTEKGEEI